MSEQKNIRNTLPEYFSVDHDSAIPLHKQVEELLRRMIREPEYEDGKLLPKEVDMANALGISRNTIRQATGVLVQENRLFRKKGVGTRVVKHRLTTKLDHWFSFSQEMHEKGLEFTNFELAVTKYKADQQVADKLEIQEGKDVLRLERLRGMDKSPIVYFISYFHPRIGLKGSEDFSGHLYEILEQYASIPSVSKEEIRAISADKLLAEKLRVNEGDPILFRNRTVCDPGNRPIEYNLGYYRGDSFKYLIDIKR